ncbi:hypothetical protein ACFRMN_13640 [Streptomyces sp. NPDC056835]|uniref:hypothetical protein n=1 Tax=Streptomyces sp. NPDC056835 TaxID=3345956 RepID=UPI0036C5B1B5
MAVSAVCVFSAHGVSPQVRQNADHEEVEGTYGHAPDRTVVVETVTDAEPVDLPPDITPHR